MLYVCMFVCVVLFLLEKPREAQRGPERPREARRGPEKPREPERSTETHREAQRDPERRTETHKSLRQNRKLSRQRRCPERLDTQHQAKCLLQLTIHCGDRLKISPATAWTESSLSDSRHSFNVAFRACVLLAGPHVSGEMENATFKTRMFQNTTATCLLNNAVVWLCLSGASICKGIAHNNLPPAMEVQCLIVPS